MFSTEKEMKCPKCRTKNSETNKFCRECGAELSLICIQCGARLLPGDKFCEKCGQELAEAAETEKAVSDIDSERKHVTVLFSDLSGYTAMSERLDPEEVKEIMSRIFGEIAQVIAKYEGFIERFIGDAVMALFGVPKVHEDDPVRAIMAAREIHVLVEAMSPQLEGKIGQSLSMHTGINTGLVVTSAVNFERGTHGIIGDTINLASGLQSLAKAGEILVGPDTYRQVEGYFTFIGLEPMKIKGKREPVQPYRVVGMKPRSGWVRGLATHGIRSPMVGREKALKKLEIHVLNAIRGEGSIVSIIGEPGIGKSRLIAELKRENSVKRMTLLEGRALDIGKNLSFHPLIDIMKSWARIREDDREAESTEKLEKAIANIFPQEVTEVFPFLATLMGMRVTGKYAERLKGIEGEALEKLILKSIREFIIKLGKIRPILFIIDDLHWSDLTTIEFLKSIFRLTTDHGVLFINLFRPNYKETTDSLLETIRKKYGNYSSEIHLEPLDEQHCEILINNLIKVRLLPGPIRRRIIARAEGNPFFIEEVVRSFIDEGIIDLKDGSFRFTDKIESVVIPGTIQDVVMARIDMLDEKTKDLLKVASVIGRNFFYKILAEVAKPIDDIKKKLEYLKAIQLIRERKRMGEIEYLFKHGLTQEATYKAILLKKRKVIHIEVASAIESVFAGQLRNFYGVLAYHYSNGEHLDKTEDYLLKAGKEALKSSASREALNYYQEALKFYIE